jgi:hypothetical protein
MKKKSGLAHSPLFPKSSEVVTIHPVSQSVKKDVQLEPALSPSADGTMIPNNHATTVSSHRDTVPPSNHDSMQPRHQETIQQVRKAVKVIGKEAATHRLTVQEKRTLGEVIYRYKQQGIKTSENEIARIAINYLLLDYQSQGENSILAEVLRKLNQ